MHQLCVHCGYDAAGNSGITCPECGKHSRIPARLGTAWFANSLTALCFALTGVTWYIMTFVAHFYGPALLAHLSQWAATLLLTLVSALRFLYVVRIGDVDPGRWRIWDMGSCTARVGLAAIALACSHYFLRNGRFFAV